jgi:hypothetical protein
MKLSLSTQRATSASLRRAFARMTGTADELTGLKADETVRGWLPRFPRRGSGTAISALLALSPAPSPKRPPRTACGPPGGRLQAPTIARVAAVRSWKDRQSDDAPFELPPCRSRVAERPRTAMQLCYADTARPFPQPDLAIWIWCNFANDRPWPDAQLIQDADISFTVFYEDGGVRKQCRDGDTMARHYRSRRQDSSAVQPNSNNRLKRRWRFMQG